MADPDRDKQQPQRLSERIENHRKEVQSLVKQGGEQPQYEFKRTVSLSRESLDDRLDFIKLMQALANAEITGERSIVVGADPTERKFYPVTNPDDLDAANISKILNAYLHPVPRFTAFHLTTDEVVPFVLIVLDGHQPRPITVIKQGRTATGKTRLEVGDIWMKKNTDTVRAIRADLDLMYSSRIEEEAEDRARKRVKHLLELSAVPQMPRGSIAVVPVFGLLVGPKNDLRRFAEELIATGELPRFRMLLELAREALVEGWDNLDTRGPGLPADVNQFTAELNDFYRNQFLPSLEAVIELGLIIIKHNASQEWLDAVVDLLIEGFDASRSLNRLKSGRAIQQGDSLPSWRPAFEIYIGITTIGTYAVNRNRLKFLGTILPRLVTRISIDYTSRQVKRPILLWPFWGLSFDSGEFNDGRASFYWRERIDAAWGKYFGNAAKFLESSSELEFLLEFNSYFGTNSLNDPKLQDWLRLNVADTTFDYIPDLYAHDLQSTTPMAERIYDILSSGELFPSYLAVEPRLFLVVFGSIPAPKRLEIYGGFLHHLKVWQARYMREALGRFGFMWDWEGRLKEIVQAFRGDQKPKNTTS